ncbi:cyclic nucleotide-binding domain-containing protein [Maritalea porphyrae]|uniref:Transcriptional regulator n=1 Tax=Maritalea porphyrae TaxID=880732 RepID=A0ABQ5UKP9_9HYPH|nr:cyclic nucleotide-binding domain-containing protein [Maritalea porphyrae]GLQ15838.1 transcriptional regulator [Maritalea porphyrae]
MRPDDLPQIRELNIFEGISDENFDELMRASFLQTFPAQMELIEEGEPADFLHIVVEGCVELFASTNGRESTMAMVYPVSSFILAAILRDAVYLMSARTNKKSRVLMIPAVSVREVFDKDPAFSKAMVMELANCYRGVIKEHKNLKLRTSVERLANRLLRYRQKQQSDQVTLPYDKKILASNLGMTPENLSRAFNTLKPYGVKVEGNKITLTDIEALATFAKPSKLIDDLAI